MDTSTHIYTYKLRSWQSNAPFSLSMIVDLSCILILCTGKDVFVVYTRRGGTTVLNFRAGLLPFALLRPHIRSWDGQGNLLVISRLLSTFLCFSLLEFRFRATFWCGILTQQSGNPDFEVVKEVPFPS